MTGNKRDSNHPGPWYAYVTGHNDAYPMQILKATYGAMLQRLQMIRDDHSDPDHQDVHHWQQRNPVILEALVQLMLGAPNHIYHGGLMHTSVRYFDPAGQRPGIPRRRRRTGGSHHAQRFSGSVGQLASE